MKKEVDDTLKPLNTPPFPNVDGLSDEEARHIVLDFLNSYEWILEENARRFEKAMKKIKRCAFLRGFLNPFGLPLEETHFSWCPAPYWINQGQNTKTD